MEVMDESRVRFVQFTCIDSLSHGSCSKIRMEARFFVRLSGNARNESAFEKLNSEQVLANVGFAGFSPELATDCESSEPRTFLREAPRYSAT